MALAPYDTDILRLIQRSPDRGDGWRSVSDACWSLLERVAAQKLIEIDEDQRRVRLSPEGLVIAEFAL